MSNNNKQLEVTKEIFPDSTDDTAFGGDISSVIGIIPWLAGAGETIPGWWSKSRDAELRRFWKNGDHIAGTVYTLRDMLKTVPFKVLPRDGTIKAHRRQAKEYQTLLENRFESRGNTSERGWDIGYGAGLEDYHTQDNGSFIAIEGPGSPDGPVEGIPSKLIHLDSFRCQRTGNKEFPVIFQDTDGARYKLHTTRVAVMTSMPSPIAEMFGVGLCAVSRAIHTAQSLQDNARYKEEKMGSRPRRALLAALGGGKKDVEAIQSAMMMSGEGMDNAGLSRYSTIPLVALRSGLTLELFDFASLPDGFNAVDDTQLGMSVLALAFGVDVRQLAFALGVTGQTRSDAEIQNIKMQGKGPGSILKETTRVFERQILPPHLKLVFDFQDDTQDERVANIRKTRAEKREKDIGDGSISIRVARELMVEDGDLSQEQFVQLELEDFRLEDGSDVTTLRFSNDKVIQAILNVGEGTEEEFQRQIEMAQKMIMTAPNATLKNKARSALAALKKMQEPVEEEAEIVEEEGQEITEETETEEPVEESE
jgi:hypothetical protein